MRTIISKSAAVRYVVLIFALIGILAVWPVRVFTQTLQTSGGGQILTDEQRGVNIENGDFMQEFVAQYERLSSLDVYVYGMERGRYLSCILYDENSAVIFKTYVDTADIALPGYVNIPVEVNVEVGKTYAFKVRDCRSKFYIGLEDIPADSAYVGNLTDHYELVEGRHLAARYNYRLPMSKQKSLLIIGIIAAVAALICVLSGMYFKRNPEKDSILTVGSVVKCTANPVAALFFGALIIMVFPLKVFDSRPVDIIFYELGLLITAAIVFYAINHKSVKHEIGISFWQSLKNEDRLRYILIMFSMAMAIWYGSCYMNDLYDIFHFLSERRMTIWLLVMMLLTFSFKEAVNICNLVWVVGSVSYGVHYYNLHRMAETEKEYDLNNLVLKYNIIIAVLGGILILNIIRTIARAIRKPSHASEHEGSNKVYPSAFGIVLLAFLILIVVFRNTRLWGIYLALTFIVFYIRLAVWKKNGDYYKILSGGLMMNFAISLIHSYLHRYFAGYVSGRFAFIFHTVTVTAEYLTFMGAAATVLLVIKIVSLPKGTGLREIFVSAWKEMTLFGFIMSYAIFTVSRTAILAIAVSVFMVVAVVMMCYKKEFFRIIGVFALSVILCFPAAFTMQRILPTISADPVWYPIDDADEFVRGGADWDSTNFMCVERFVNLFESKILGADVGMYEYPIDKYNYADEGRGELLLDDYGRPFEELEDEDKDGGDAPSEDGQGCIPGAEPYSEDEGDLLASVGMTRAEMLMLMDDLQGYVDLSNPLDVLSNGRITIFRAYMQQLNMTGHEEMGAELPNGEIAVHAHNTYLQVAYDHGIPAGILFFLVLVMALAGGIGYYRKKRSIEPLSLITPAIVIGFMVAGVSEWVFQYSNPMTIALMLAIAPLTYRERTK